MYQKTHFKILLQSGAGQQQFHNLYVTTSRRSHQSLWIGLYSHKKT